jgi:hypothetical protein
MVLWPLNRGNVPLSKSDDIAEPIYTQLTLRYNGTVVASWDATYSMEDEHYMRIPKWRPGLWFAELTARHPYKDTGGNKLDLISVRTMNFTGAEPRVRIEKQAWDPSSKSWKASWVSRIIVDMQCDQAAGCAKCGMRTLRMVFAHCACRVQVTPDFQSTCRPLRRT